MKTRIVFRLLALTMLLAGPAAADQIAVGTLGFNQFIPELQEPGQESVGTNAFFVINLTGVFPDEEDILPTPATFTEAYLTLFSGSGPGTAIPLTSLTAGSQFVSDLFPASSTFTAAVFTGVLDGLNWTLFGELSHVDGSPLAPGEFAPIYASFQSSNEQPGNTPSSVPEPATLALLGSGLGVAARRLRRRP